MNNAKIANMTKRMAKTQKKIMVFVFLVLIFILVLTGLSGHHQMLQRLSEALKAAQTQLAGQEAEAKTPEAEAVHIQS